MMDENRSQIPSRHAPALVDISGFDASDDSLHMIEWLRRGKDFRQFVVNDVETELYAQDGGSQLLSLACGVPEFETKLRPESPNGEAVITQFGVIFPVLAHVVGGDGRHWKLQIRHGYQATNMDVPGKFNLQMNFTIVGHEAEG
jgi:hypothetical protein